MRKLLTIIFFPVNFVRIWRAEYRARRSFARLDATMAVAGVDKLDRNLARCQPNMDARDRKLLAARTFLAQKGRVRHIRVQEALSMNEKREALSAAVRDKFRSGWVNDVYDDYLIAELYDTDSKERLLKIDYLIDDSGAVALGESVEVRRETSYVPVENPPALIVSEATVEIPTDATFVQVSEAAKETLSRGAGLIKVIAPGWNADNSIYYTPDVLKRDLSAALPKGTKMFANHRKHPSTTRRTEGKIEEVAAVLTADAVWMDNGPDGPGGYAYIQAKETWLPTLAQLKDDIAPSIDLDVLATRGEADGKRGNIVQKLFNSGLGSVDFVTTPGTDAKIISLQEAAKEAPKPQEESTMLTPEEEQALRAENERLKGQNAALQASQARAVEARRVASSHEKVTALPIATQRRVVETLVEKAPATAEGALDTEAFSTQIERVATEAAQELQEARGGAAPSPVRGMGPGTATRAAESRTEGGQEPPKMNVAHLGL